MSKKLILSYFSTFKSIFERQLWFEGLVCIIFISVKKYVMHFFESAEFHRNDFSLTKLSHSHPQMVILRMTPTFLPVGEEMSKREH